MPTKPDNWGAYPTAAPGSTPKDWTNSPWGDVAWQAARNLIPSYVGDTVSGAKAIAQGVGSMFVPQSPAQIKAAQIDSSRRAMHPWSSDISDISNVAHGVGNYVNNTYTAPGALKNTLARDPARPLMDLQALATIPEGGEGFAADMPGAAGSIARGAIQGAKTISRGTNPIYMGARGIGAAANAAQTAIRGGSALDATGAFTPAARTAIQQAFPAGQITDTELANPQFKAALAKTFQTKGVSPAAAREAVLTYNGATPVRSAVTGVRPPPAAASTVSDAVASSRQALGQKALTISGAAQPDPSALGAALEDANAKAYAAAGQKYENIRQMPGSFGPKLDGPALNADLSTALQKTGVPSTPDLLARSSDAYPQANKAVNMLNDALVSGNTRLGGEVTAPEIMEVRSQLTNLQADATGKDKAAMGAIIDGFHNHLENAAGAGQFMTPTPAGTMAANTDLSGALKDANATYKNYFNTFQNPQGPSGAISRAVKNLAGSANAGLSGDEAQMAAQKGLAAKLNSPTEGPATHSLLLNALGGPDTPGAGALNDYVKQSALKLNDDGTLAAKPGQISQFLNGPMADKVMTPEEQSDARLLSAAHDTLNTKPSASPSNPIGAAVAQVGRAGLGTIAGGAVAHFLPVTGLPPGVSEIAGGLGGLGLERGLEHLNNARQVAAATAGAPAVGGYLNAPIGVADAMATTARAAPLAGVAGDPSAQPAVPKTPPVQMEQIKPDVVPVVTPDVSASPADPTVAAPAAPPREEQTDWSKFPTAPPDQTDTVPAGNAAGGRIGLASGGKAGRSTEEMIQDLMSRAEKAKKAEDASTKPLLHVPDNAVAKALEVAGSAL